MPDATPRRILLVEDDREVGAVVVEVLADEGFEVRWARDGHAALGELETWWPDLIVLDLMMPVLDGRGFRAAQLQLPDERALIPVLVLSGAREASSTAAVLGAVGTISKPFELDELLAKVARALADGSARTRAH